MKSLLVFLEWYFMIALVCWPIAHGIGAVRNGRGRNYRYGMLFEGLRIFFNDHCRVHCPWSWRTARAARIAAMKSFLGETGRYHDVLGYIRASDCTEIEKQDLIVYYCYEPRALYWKKAMRRILLAPFGLFALLITPY